MRPNTIIRACKFGDYLALAAIDEFVDDRRIDMQQGTLMVAERDGNTVGFAKVSPAEFLGWPLLSICVLRRHFGGKVSAEI